eukprot:1322133-Pyramimonas_sp.AAC.1
MGPPVSITARLLSTLQRPFPFSHPMSSSSLSPTALPLGPANYSAPTMYTGASYGTWISPRNPYVAHGACSWESW